MSKSQDSIVVVGAGIIGLNVALVLAQRGLGESVTVIAEHLPGDTAATYTSPWAGCNFSALSASDANALRWDKLGYSHLTGLATTESEKAFVQKTPSTELWDDAVPHDKIKSMSEYLEDFHALTDEELPKGVKFGVSFTTVTLNAPQHLLYLRNRLETDYGVRFIRQKLRSLESAYASPSTKVVFNCVGLAAQTFAGVQDPNSFPTRGQIVLARAPSVKKNIMRHGRDYETYVIPRPGSNGNIILGGYMQKGNGDGSTYGDQTNSILERTKGLSTEVASATPEVLGVFSGLRPSRHGGTRVERDSITISGTKRPVVHNYGAGGAGFQAGYGMAVDAVAKADDILSQVGNDTTKARL